MTSVNLGWRNRCEYIHFIVKLLAVKKLSWIPPYPRVLPPVSLLWQTSLHTGGVILWKEESDHVSPKVFQQLLVAFSMKPKFLGLKTSLLCLMLAYFSALFLSLPNICHAPIVWDYWNPPHVLQSHMYTPSLHMPLSSLRCSLCPSHFSIQMSLPPDGDTSKQHKWSLL